MDTSGKSALNLENLSSLKVSDDINPQSREMLQTFQTSNQSSLTPKNT